MDESVRKLVADCSSPIPPAKIDDAPAKIGDPPAPPKLPQIEIDPERLEALGLTRQFLDLATLMRETLIATHALMHAIGKCPAIDAESFAVDVIAGAARSPLSAGRPIPDTLLMLLQALAQSAAEKRMEAQ